MQEQYDVIVVGGGAAGMFAAIHVGLAGKRVLLLERNDRLGKKLRITGKGRCNVTNCCTAEEVLQHVPRNGRFLYSAVTQYPPARMMEFLESEGCPLKTERGNRVFPVSDSSASVQQALERALGRAGVTVRQSRVLEVWTDAGQVAGVRTDQEQIPAGKVILATGGCSYPATGSTGDGYRMAAQLGHTVIPPTGSLVPLEEAGTDCGQMQGLSLRNVAVRLVHEKGKCVYRDFGELLFTHFGLSGPTVLSASAHMGKPGAYQLVIDLKPALEEGKLDARILRDLELYQNRSMVNALTDLLPRSMIPVILRRTQIPETLEANSLTRQQRHSLVRELKNFAVPIAGKRPVEEAIVTSGGVKTGEVNPKTMESKRVPGLYFAGEILDCDAYTGGFNLQIAWSTAYAAAMACRALSGCGGHDEFAENG